MGATPGEDTKPLRLRVYISSASRLLSEAELEQLLLKSRSRNIENGITGILLYAEGSFLQAFEGPVDAVEQLNDSLLNDSLHKGVLQLVKEDTDERLFADWTMGFHVTTLDRYREIDGVSDYLDTGRLDQSIDHRQVLILLNSFRRLNSRAA